MKHLLTAAVFASAFISVTMADEKKSIQDLLAEGFEIKAMAIGQGGATWYAMQKDTVAYYCFPVTYVFTAYGTFPYDCRKLSR